MRLRVISVLWVMGFWLALAGVPMAAHADPGGMDYKFETSDFMRHTAYRNVEKIDNEDAPDGAYGPVNRAWDSTHQGVWYIELQRNGGDLIDAGVAAHNMDAIKRGLVILNWGFSQQQADGSFDCPDPFHSASFFIESTAHALLLMRTAGLEPSFQTEFNAILPRLHQAALWMIKPDVMAKGIQKNMPFTHRRYLVAAALGETGVLVHDDALVKTSREFIQDGLSLQAPEGYNPEKGGYDSSYNAVGLLYAERYYANVADKELRKALYNMLSRGVAWEASRIAPDGTIMTEGNTRVEGGNSEKDRTGKTKVPAAGQVFRVFAYWAEISHEHSYLNVATRVATAAHMIAR